MPNSHCEAALQGRRLSGHDDPMVTFRLFRLRHGNLMQLDVGRIPRMRRNGLFGHCDL